MITSSFQDEYMDCGILGEAIGDRQASSASSYDNIIIGFG